MARPELGTKRTCANCGAKFYDLNNDPITCPKCGAVLDLTTLVTTKPAAKPAEEASEEAAEADEPEEGLVALEEADAEAAETGRAGTEPAAEEVPDLEEEEFAAGDKADEFLDESEAEEDDDVSSLIEGDPDDEED